MYMPGPKHNDWFLMILNAYISCKLSTKQYEFNDELLHNFMISNANRGHVKLAIMNFGIFYKDANIAF